MASQNPPADFWRLMPQNLTVVAPSREVRLRLETALTPAVLADSYSFVLEVGSVPDCLLVLFTNELPNTATSSFIFKVAVKDKSVLYEFENN
jgi:hypothetical protein